MTDHETPAPATMYVSLEQPVTASPYPVEVTVHATGPHHAAVLLNAAAYGADQTLRALDMTHPAHTHPDQCGRTFVHLPHQTTGGWCAGLDGTEAREPDLFTEADEEPEPQPIGYRLERRNGDGWTVTSDTFAWVGHALHLLRGAEQVYPFEAYRVGIVMAEPDHQTPVHGDSVVASNPGKRARR